MYACLCQGIQITHEHVLNRYLYLYCYLSMTSRLRSLTLLEKMGKNKIIIIIISKIRWRMFLMINSLLMKSTQNAIAQHRLENTNWIHKCIYILKKRRKREKKIKRLIASNTDGLKKRFSERIWVQVYKW